MEKVHSILKKNNKLNNNQKKITLLYFSSSALSFEGRQDIWFFQADLFLQRTKRCFLNNLPRIAPGGSQCLLPRPPTRPGHRQLCMDVLIQIISQKVKGFAFSWAFERMRAVGRVAEPSQPPALGQGQKGSLGTGSPQEPPPSQIIVPPRGRWVVPSL